MFPFIEIFVRLIACWKTIKSLLNDHRGKGQSTIPNLIGPLNTLVAFNIIEVENAH